MPRALILMSLWLPCLAFARGGSSGGGGTVHVHSYTRSDGTQVRAYDRSAPGSRSSGGSYSGGGSDTSSPDTSADNSTADGQAEELADYTATRPADIATAIRLGIVRNGMTRDDARWAMVALRRTLYGKDTPETAAKAHMKRVTTEPEQWLLEVEGREPQLVRFIGGYVTYVGPDDRTPAPAASPAAEASPPTPAPVVAKAPAKRAVAPPKAPPAKPRPPPDPPTNKVFRGENASESSGVLPGLCCVLFVVAGLGAVIYWLANLTPSQKGPVAPPAPQLAGRALPSGAMVNVVGESQHHHALAALCSPTGDDVQTMAMLVLEPTNSFDRNAVAVYISGRRVGYLSREDALTYKPLGERLLAEGAAGMCGARIIGGARSATGRKAQINVMLDLSLARAVQTEADVLSRALAALQEAKTSGARKKVVAEAQGALASQDLRMKLLAEASRIEVDAVLAKVEGLKTDSAKRRNLLAALEEIRRDPVPDELQAAQISALEEALRKLEA